MKKRTYRAKEIKTAVVSEIVKGREGRRGAVGIDVGKDDLFMMLRWDDGSFMGYGYRMPDDWVCPVGAVDEAITAAIVRDLLDGYAGDLKKVTVQIAGTAGRLLPQLLRAGMRASGGAQLLYCSNGRVPSPSYLPYSGYLP